MGKAPGPPFQFRCPTKHLFSQSNLGCWNTQILSNLELESKFLGIDSSWNLIMISLRSSLAWEISEGHFNINLPSDHCRRSYCVDKRWFYGCIITIMGFPLLIWWHLCIETGSRALIQCKDTVLPIVEITRSSYEHLYLHNGVSYTGKMTSLYWIRAQNVSCPGTGITNMIPC